MLLPAPSPALPAAMADDPSVTPLSERRHSAPPALCAAVSHSAGSQLPLEGTARYQMAQMTEIKIVYCERAPPRARARSVARNPSPIISPAGCVLLSPPALDV